MGALTFNVGPGWRLLMIDLGMRPAAILKRARLPLDLFANEKTGISAEEYFRLWDALVAEAKDPLLPLRIGKAISMEAFDPPVFASMCSPNYRVALERIAKYKPLIGPMSLHIREKPTSLSMTVEWLDSTAVPPEAVIAAELVFFVQLARMGTRARICPLEVTSTVPLAPKAEYARWFGTPVRVGKKVGLTFAIDDVEMPFVTANASMWSFFEPSLQKTLDTLSHNASIAERVKATLLELIPSGLASMEEVAGKLGTSVRTLQRNLYRDGTRFQELLAATREELALHYLKNSKMSGAEISFLLGFDDPNSFFRAFRAWTGETPEQKRATMAPRQPESIALL